MNASTAISILHPALVARDAAWFVRSVGPTGLAEAVTMTAESYARSNFLDHRISLPQGVQTGVVRFTSLALLYPDISDRETAFIFHIGHVGSTLLSQALGTAPQVLALREPVLLRWLAEIRLDLDRPESRFTQAGFDAALRTALGLLARPLPGHDRVIVKATSDAGSLAADILALQPRSRAIALYSRFEDFAPAILKGGAAWLDVSRQGPSRLRRLHATLGKECWQLAGMSPGELVALNWLTEMATLTLAYAKHRTRLTWFEFDDFISGGLTDFPALAGALGLPWDDETAERIRASGVLSRHSHDLDREFSFGARFYELHAVRVEHAGEIARGEAWLQRAYDAHPLLFAVRHLAENPTEYMIHEA